MIVAALGTGNDAVAVLDTVDDPVRATTVHGVGQGHGCVHGHAAGHEIRAGR